MQHVALIVAAGVGSRYAANTPKQYAHIAGQALLVHTVQALLKFEPFQTVWVVVAPYDPYIDALITNTPSFSDARLRFAKVGGETRTDSVRNGLSAIQAGLLAAKTTAPVTVWVHDAARPAVHLNDLNALASALQSSPAGALLATPVADTLKRVVGNTVAMTLPRTSLWQAQTPQCFELNLLIRAIDQAANHGLALTDEASAIEALGLQPIVVPGRASNFKVTTQHDAQLMEAILMPQTAPTPSFSIGEGMDVHALVPGRPLILGGVNIPHHAGLLGHSDADALLHAITDALLGAAGLGDIGRLFPDTDVAHAGADSQDLLCIAYEKVSALGWIVGNVDATVIAQAPKLASHIPAMQNNIAQCLSVKPSQVNVKAKTNERLGWLGREEGMEARAVLVLLRG